MVTDGGEKVHSLSTIIRRTQEAGLYLFVASKELPHPAKREEHAKSKTIRKSTVRKPLPDTLAIDMNKLKPKALSGRKPKEFSYHNQPIASMIESERLLMYSSCRISPAEIQLLELRTGITTGYAVGLKELEAATSIKIESLRKHLYKIAAKLTHSSPHELRGHSADSAISAGSPDAVSDETRPKTKKGKKKVVEADPPEIPPTIEKLGKFIPTLQNIFIQSLPTLEKRVASEAIIFRGETIAMKDLSVVAKTLKMSVAKVQAHLADIYAFLEKTWQSATEIKGKKIIYTSLPPEEITAFVALPIERQQAILDAMMPEQREIIIARYNLNFGTDSIPYTRPIEDAYLLTTFDLGQFRSFSANILVYIQRELQKSPDHPELWGLPPTLEKLMKLPFNDQILLLYCLSPMPRENLILRYHLDRLINHKITEINPELAAHIERSKHAVQMEEHSLAINNLERWIASRITKKDGTTVYYESLLANYVITFLKFSAQEQEKIYSNLGTELATRMRMMFNLDGYYGDAPFNVRIADVEERLGLEPKSMLKDSQTIRWTLMNAAGKYERKHGIVRKKGVARIKNT